MTGLRSSSDRIGPEPGKGVEIDKCPGSPLNRLRWLIGGPFCLVAASLISVTSPASSFLSLREKKEPPIPPISFFSRHVLATVLIVAASPIDLFPPCPKFSCCCCPLPFCRHRQKTIVKNPSAMSPIPPKTNPTMDIVRAVPEQRACGLGSAVYRISAT